MPQRARSTLTTPSSKPSSSSSNRLYSPALRGTDPSFSVDGITPELQAAFDLLDDEMVREGYALSSRHGNRSGARKGNNKRKTNSDNGAPSPYNNSESIPSSNKRTPNTKTTKKRNRDTPNAQTTVSSSSASSLPTITPTARLGTPLTMTSFPETEAETTDSAILAVNSGKYTVDHKPPITGGVRVDKNEMEGKKVMLPYLDRFCYIDVQLGCRPVGGGGGEDAKVGKGGVLEGPPSRSIDAPSPLDLKLGYDAGDEDFFFRAMTPSPRNERSGKSKKLDASSPVTSYKSNSYSQPPSPSASSFSEKSYTTASSKVSPTKVSKKLKMSGPPHTHPHPPSNTLSPQTLCSRYYLITLLANFHTGNSSRTTLTTLCPASSTHPPHSVIWLMRWIELIYDSAYLHEQKGGGGGGGVHVSSKERENKDAIKKGFLTVDGENVSHDIINLESGGGNDNDIAQGTSLPKFMLNFLSNKLGPGAIVRQTLYDIISCLEQYQEQNIPEINLFSKFVREVLDEDCFVFFLYSRNLLVDRLGLCLSDLKQRVYPPTVSRLKLSEDAVITTEYGGGHYHVGDGTRDVFMSRDTVTWLLIQLVPPLTSPSTSKSGEMSNMNVHEIRRYAMNRLDEIESVYTKMNGPIHSLTNGFTSVKSYTMYNIFTVLTHLVTSFSKTHNDIIKELKYNDDGYRLVMLDMLSDTVSDEVKLKDALINVNEARAKCDMHGLEIKKCSRLVDTLQRRLLDAQISKDTGSESSLELRLGQAKTTLFLMNNQTFKLNSDLERRIKEQNAIHFHHNKIWSDIITNESSGNAKKQKFSAIKKRNPGLSNAVNGAVVRFGMHLSQRCYEFKNDVNANAVISSDWRGDLELIRIKSAICLQMFYRKREVDRDAKAFASIEVTRRRKIRDASTAEAVRLQEAEAKFKRDNNDRQMARVREIIKERRLVAIRVEERDNFIRIQSAISESERRFWAINRQFITSVFQVWKLQVQASKSKLYRAKSHMISVLRAWHAVVMDRKKRVKAVTSIQRIYRGYNEYKSVQCLKVKVQHRMKKTRAVMIRLKYRGMTVAFVGWRNYAHRAGLVKRLRYGSIFRGLKQRFNSWRAFVSSSKEEKSHASAILTKFARVGIAKARRERTRVDFMSASLLQRAWRGHNGRSVCIRRVNRLLNNDKKIIHYKELVRMRTLKEYFKSMRALVKVRKGVFKIRHNLLRMVFIKGFVMNVHMIKMEKDSLHQSKNTKATQVQKQIKVHLFRQNLLQVRQFRETVVYAQSLVRKNQALTRYEIIKVNFNAASEIQRCRRGYIARGLLHSLKVVDFFEAADRNDYDRLLFYFDRLDGINDVTDGSGNNALQRSAMNGSTRCVKLCVAEGIDSNYYNNDGKTALHLCVESRKINRDTTIEWLLDHKSNMEARDIDGNTPLLLASIFGRAVACKLLCERDADVNARDYTGSSPLQLAVANDVDGSHEGAVIQLLQHAADVNQVGDDGCVPLHDIICHGDSAVTIVKHLISYDADLTMKDDDGYTPFMYAVNLNLVKVCTLLMEHHVDANTTDNAGRTPLHLAASSGSAAVIPIICEGDPDLEAKDADGDTALHIAVSLSHTAVVRALLDSGMNAGVQNIDGDQPAHLAARFGNLECMEAMLHYDSFMGRRNWAELTVIGVARMHNHVDIVELLKRHFSPEQLGETGDREDDDHTWHNRITEEVEEWEEAWDAEQQVSYWHSTKTGETRDASYPPEMEAHKIKNAYANANKAMTLRVQMQVGEGMVGTAQYIQHHEKEWAEIEEQRSEWQSATKIEKSWRMKSAKIERALLKLQRDSANVIQRAGSSWRWRFRDEHFLVSQRAAKTIQALVRGRQASHNFKQFYRERVWWRRAERILARLGQRFWRGYVGRRAHRRAFEVRRLPKPADGRNFGVWVDRQKEAHPPRRTYKLYEEFTLYGTPSSWFERKMKGENNFFRDVVFYVNKVTDKPQWAIPDDWAEEDKEQFVLRDEIRVKGYNMKQHSAAVSVQSLWNARQARKNFKLIMKAKRLGERAEGLYTSDPDDIISLCNYTLYVHVILQSYERARKLYRYMNEFMQLRGPDNSFVLYGLAIYGAVTHEEDWPVIKDYAYRGKVADHLESVKRGVPATSYNLADTGFYKMKALFDQSGESWHNYALCRMLVYNDLEGARDAFIRAVHAAPHDKKIIANFNVLIKDSDFYGRTGGWDCYDELTAHERSIAQTEEDEAADIRQVRYDASERLNAATKIQNWFRFKRQQSFLKISISAMIKDGMIPPTELAFDDASLYTEVSWEECVDEDGKVFFYNTVTGVSSWIPPNLMIRSDENSIVSSIDNGILSAGMSISSGLPLMIEESLENWELCYDDDGAKFYFNTITEASQWETPKAGSKSDHLMIEGVADGVDPEWEECFDENTGKKFYYNSILESSAWETPRELSEQRQRMQQQMVAQFSSDDPNVVEAWEECEDEEGNKFYYNEVTGDTRWHKPGEEPPDPEVWRAEILPLSRGRLIITCISADNVRVKDSTALQSAFLKIQVGDDKNNKLLSLNSKDAKNSAPSSAAIDFSSETLVFDLQDPALLLDAEGKLMVYGNLYNCNSSKSADPTVGSGSIDLIEFVTCPFWFGDEPKTKVMTLRSSDSSSDPNGSVTFKVEFWKAQPGVLRLQLGRAEGLPNSGGKMNTQDPYVKLTLNNETCRSKTITDGGVDPRFMSEEILLNVGSTEWNSPLILSILDDDYGRDGFIGHSEINLLHMMSQGGYKRADDVICKLTNKKGKKACGTLFGKIEFCPVGILNVVITGASNLRNPDLLGKPDPYLKLEILQAQPMDLKALKALKGSEVPDNKRLMKIKTIDKNSKNALGGARRALRESKQTKVINSTLNPQWLSELSFSIFDADKVNITVLDADVGKDDLIGEAQLSLLQVFESGHTDDLVSLIFKTRKADKVAGEVKLSMNFWGPPGVSFPHRRAQGTRAYNDTRRRGAGYSPTSLATSSALDLAGGAEKMSEYLNLPGSLAAPGLLRITVLEAVNVKGKDSNLNAYVLLRVGKVAWLNAARSYKTKSVQCPHSNSANPKFNEVIDIPVPDIKDLIENNDVDLHVDVYDKRNLIDTHLGSCSIKLKSTFLSNSGVEKEALYDMSPSKSVVRLKICWWRALKGAALLTLVGGRNFKPPTLKTSAKDIVPYIKVNVGKVEAKSKTIPNGGKNPNFDNEEMFIFCDSESWKSDFKMTVHDDNVVGKDTIIGACGFSLLQLMTPPRLDAIQLSVEGGEGGAENQRSSLELSLRKGTNEAGTLKYNFEFFTAGKITIKCVSGRGLRNAKAPYTELSLDDSQLSQGQQKKKTHVHNNGGADPQWNQDIVFDIIDHHEIVLRCYDKDSLLRDVLIGTARISLMQLFQKSYDSPRNSAQHDLWIPITASAGKAKGSVHAGEIHLLIYFAAAPGVRYPIHQPSISSLSRIEERNMVTSESDIVSSADAVFEDVPCKSLVEITETPRSLTDFVKGRFTVTVHDAKSTKGESKCFVRFKLGKKGAGDFTQRTKTSLLIVGRRGELAFNNEKVLFNISEVDEIIIDERTTLECSIYNYKDAAIGKCNIDITELLLRPTTSWKQAFTLEDSNGSLTMTLQFFAAYTGMIRMTLSECRNIPNSGKQDPYFRFTLEAGERERGGKKQIARSKPVRGGVTDPSFDREQVVLWSSEDAMFTGLEIDLLDEDTQRDDSLGNCHISLFEYAALLVNSSIGPRTRKLQLVKNNAYAGELIVVLEFMPAANLTITCLRGRNLKSPSLFGSFHPYLRFESESQCGSAGDFDLRCKAAVKGGKAADWGGEVVSLSVCDHAIINISCFSNSNSDKDDDLVGRTEFNVVAALERMRTEKWIPLTTKNGKSAGEILLSFACTLPIACNNDVAGELAYPYARPNITGVRIGDAASALEVNRAGADASDEVESENESDLSWEERTDDDGHYYYYNTLTEATSLSLPKGFIPSNVAESSDILNVIPSVKSFAELTKIVPVFTDERIQRGRVDVKVHWCEGVKSNDEGLDSNMKCYVVCKIGDAEKRGNYKANTRASDVVGSTVNFNDENLHLLIRDWDQFARVLQVDDPRCRQQIMLTFELFTENNSENDVSIGKIEIDIFELLTRPAQPWNEAFDLVGGDGGKINITIQFLAAYEGLIRMKSNAGVELRRVDAGDPSPYVLLSLEERNGKNKQTVKTLAVEGGGVNPNFGGEQLLLWCGEENMFEGCKIEIWNDDRGRDDFMGSCLIDLFQYAALATTSKYRVVERLLPVHTKRGELAGELQAEFDFYPSLNLDVVIRDGRDLSNRNPKNLIGTSESYVKIESKSQTGEFGNKLARSKTVTGGKDPNWGGEVLSMALVDHSEMIISIYDDDDGREEFVGSSTLRLSDIYNWSVTLRDKWDQEELQGGDVKVGKWIPILTKKGKPAGDVLMEFRVKVASGGNRNAGARRLCYPQARKGVKPMDVFKLQEKLVWTKSAGEGGHTYYFNTLTKETSWEEPEGGYVDKEVTREMEAAKSAEEASEVEEDGGFEDENASMTALQPTVITPNVVDDLDDLMIIPPLLSSMKKGRLVVQFNEAREVVSSDGKDKTKPRKSVACYVLCRLSKSNKSEFRKKTRTSRLATDGSPKFNGEKLYFDLQDIDQICKAIVDAGEKSLILTCELFDDNYIKDVCLGKCEIDVKDLLMRPVNQWKQFFKLDIGEGKLGLSLTFLPSYSGIARVTLAKAQKLTNQDSVSLLDPYVRITVKGNDKKRTRTIKNGGSNVDLKSETLVFWCDEDASFNGMKIDIIDDDSGKDELIGSATIDLFLYSALSTSAVEAPRERLYPLRLGGDLIASVEFFQSCNLQIIVKEGKDLRNPRMLSKNFDPYLTFVAESVCGENGWVKLRSRAVMKGNKSPDWNDEELYGLLCDHTKMVISCQDDETNDFIGLCEVDLLEVYKEGSLSKWFQLSDKKGSKRCGEVFVTINVRNSRGLSEEVELKNGYPVIWDGRGIGGDEVKDGALKKKEKKRRNLGSVKEIVQPLIIRGYGIRGKTYDRAIPFRQGSTSKLL